jgi:4-aminobutyrate aminotransferase
MTEPKTSTGARVIARHQEFLFPCVKPLYKEPLIISRASGTRVTDISGKHYLDFYAGILTTSVGHCHPHVVESVRDQLGKLGHTSTLYTTENQISVAEALSEIAPGRLQSCFFTNSGSEAVETAVMLARLCTGRQEIIALRNSYSGRTSLTASMTATPSWRPLGSLDSGIRHCLSPYPYRSPFDQNADLAEKFANDLEEVIQTTTSGRPAAFFAETIQGAGGYIVPPPGYFQLAAEIIHSHGGLFICDEVQAGFGRTGDHWFGIEHWEVEPDIMVMAKGIANGMPVGVTITRPDIAQTWTPKSISTFGGNPVSMAAAKATLTVMGEENTPARSAQRGQQLRSGLDSIKGEFSWIGEVRGMGLMQALELVDDPISKEPDPARASSLLEATRSEGLLVGIGGTHGHVIRLGPSMLVTEDEVTEGLNRLSRACKKADVSA